LVKTACFECFSGISGDMCLGALVDAGVSVKALEKALKTLPVKGYKLVSAKVSRGGIAATKVDVVIRPLGKQHGHEHKMWKDIEKIIKASSLPADIRTKGSNVFRRLFEAEAAVHGKPFHKVHLHELGGTDCLVDIFGTLIGLDILGVGKVYATPVNLGSGLITTGHGVLPVPAPATMELLKGAPVYSSGAAFELATPTGAAILAGLNADFSGMPVMRVKNIGYGAGGKEVTGMPNVLRILVGNGEREDLYETVAVIETNIDDMNPQIYEDVCRKLSGAGALDVFLENVIMKKGRPAQKLTVLARESDVERLSDLIFRETTTIGLRIYKVMRKTLGREIKSVKTKYGQVRLKLSRLKGKVVNVSPEYDDLKALSEKCGVPIKRIVEELRAASRGS